jgi:GTP-binding protein YchF
MRVGIIGLPNAGKSTLFNALTRAGAEAADYPFTTVDPNVGIATVPDSRLDRLADALGIDRRVPEQIEIVDIAGLVRGAHKGEGLGNRFLGHVRDVDAVLHVVRSFDDARIAHPHGQLDPVGDLEAVETELLLADLETAERRLADRRPAAGAEGAAALGPEFWEPVVESLRAGRAAPPEAGLLSSKPVLVVVNAGEGEGDAIPGALADRGNLITVNARDEYELGELDPQEAASLRGELELGESALERVAAAAYRLLDLITFFTAVGGEEVRARSLRRGGTALDAAAHVHTDMAHGFVRAEVIGFEELIEAGSFARARELGRLRVEGRDYVVADGDVVTVKFT